jgi:hypothetical protein
MDESSNKSGNHMRYHPAHFITCIVRYIDTRRSVSSLALHHLPDKEIIFYGGLLYHEKQACLCPPANKRKKQMKGKH